METKELGTKVCPRCKLEQALDEFTRDKSRPDGRETYCRTCKRAYRADRYETHHEEILARGNEYNQRPEVKKHKQEYERQPEVRARRRAQGKTPESRQRERERGQTPEAKTKQKEYDRAHNQLPESKDSHREQVKRYAAGHPEWLFVQRAKLRAKKKGVPFALQPEDITIPTVCPVLGLPLEVGTKAKTDHSPSIDEIVPGIGYVAGNVAIISDRANHVKNDGSAKEHRAIAAWMDTRLFNRAWVPPTRRASTSKEKRVVTSAKQRAKKKGLSFDLRLEDIEFPEQCPVFGVPLVGGSRHKHDSAPSLDRIDATKGYTLDNVAIISHRANFVKSNGTAEEHRKIADWIDKMTTQSPKTVV